MAGPDCIPNEKIDMTTRIPADTPKLRTVSYFLTAAALLAVLHFHFLPLLLSVILTYIFITRTNGLILWFRRRLFRRNAFLRRSLNAHNVNLLSATLTIGLVLLAIVLMAFGVYHLIHGGHIAVMMGKLAAIIEDTKKQCRPCRHRWPICCRTIWPKSKRRRPGC